MKDTLAATIPNSSQIDIKWRVGYNIPAEEGAMMPPEVSSPSNLNFGRNLGSLIEFDGFSDEQINAMLASAQELESLMCHANRMTPVTEAYRQFTAGIVSTVDKREGLQQALLEQNLNSYISQFDMYKNHWEKFIKTNLKATNPSKAQLMEEVFVRETHAAFDSNTGFALACCIRDFMTHSNTIIDHFGASYEGIKLTMQRDRLLNDFSWNKTKQGLISSQEEELNLIQIVAESYTELLRINELLLDFMLDEEICRSCETLIANRKAIANAGVKSKDWVLYRFTGTETVRVPADFPGNAQGGTMMKQGLGMDWIELRWDWYRAVYEKCRAKNVG